MGARAPPRAAGQGPDRGRRAPVTGGEGGPGPTGGAGPRWRRPLPPRGRPSHAGEGRWGRQKEDPKEACGGGVGLRADLPRLNWDPPRLPLPVLGRTYASPVPLGQPRHPGSLSPALSSTHLLQPGLSTLPPRPNSVSDQILCAPNLTPPRSLIGSVLG